MRAQGDRQIFSRNSGAVVDDFDEIQAPALQRDGHAGGAGVHGVLDEFLDDRCRAFDDLAGRDLADGLDVENADRRHYSFKSES